MQPLISIIIATYNRAAYIGRTIESIRAQSVGPIEIIIVDDGSTDNTEVVVKSMMRPDVNDIVYVKQGSNQGATAARNKGLDIARGQWLLVWDSDDTLDPHALATLMQTAATFPEAGVVSAPCRAVRGKAQTPEVFPRRATGFISQREILCRLLPANTKIRLVKRDAFLHVRYQLKNLDFLVNVALAERAAWYHLDTDLGTLYIEQDSVSLTSHRKKPNPELSQKRAVILDQFLTQYGEVMKKECPFYYSAYAYGAAVGLMLSSSADDQRKARTYAKGAWQYQKNVTYGSLYLLSLVPGAQVLLKKLFSAKKKLGHF